ncbi:MAG: porin [Sphingomonadales bacterium]|nr:porin [Sphingomonadales bacterium]MBD3773424.1 porin [Paracoccaceae bacterium]
MVPASVQAKDTGEQDRWAAIEARLDKIEARIDGIEQRVETGQATQQDIATAREIRGVVADTRAETQAVSAKTDSLEQRVAAVEKKTPGSGFNVGSTNISIGGYVKLDAISERTSGGQLAGNAITRDFLLPSTIPVGGTASGWDTDFNARQSRIIIKTSTPVGDKAVGTLLEMDFMVTDGGDERVSNSYTPRMRQAYITYDGWLFGQAWSTFQNVGALPDSLDFVGTMPGTVFVRQPMIRYAKNGFSVAVEQPETTITTATGGRILPGDDSMPDVVVRYDKSGLAIAGIVRQLHASSLVLPTGSDSAFGYGVSISGKVPLGESSDFRFMGTVGQGLGRYLGANIVNDAAIDANGKLDPITTYSGFAAFQHKWSPKLRSTLAGSYFKADNPILFTGTSPTDTVWNALANIIYSPVPKLDVGIEYMYAERENEAGLSGNLQKVQVSAKYSF